MVWTSYTRTLHCILDQLACLESRPVDQDLLGATRGDLQPEILIQPASAVKKFSYFVSKITTLITFFHLSRAHTVNPARHESIKRITIISDTLTDGSLVYRAYRARE